jgi:hypothetical protein
VPYAVASRNYPPVWAPSAAMACLGTRPVWAPTTRTATNILYRPTKRAVRISVQCTIRSTLFDCSWTRSEENMDRILSEGGRSHNVRSIAVIYNSQLNCLQKKWMSWNVLIDYNVTFLKPYHNTLGIPYLLSCNAPFFPVQNTLLLCEITAYISSRWPAQVIDKIVIICSYFLHSLCG